MSKVKRLRKLKRQGKKTVSFMRGLEETFLASMGLSKHMIKMGRVFAKLVENNKKLKKKIETWTQELMKNANEIKIGSCEECKFKEEFCHPSPHGYPCAKFIYEKEKSELKHVLWKDMTDREKVRDMRRRGVIVECKYCTRNRMYGCLRAYTEGGPQNCIDFNDRRIKSNER